jgi:uncharacterized OsmC-like protein
MAESADLKTALERHIKAIKLRPSAGRGTATTTVKIRSGVTCDVADGGWKLVADEGPGDGGAGLGPDPGVFGRAALGTCLAMGYVIWSTHLGVTFDSVEVVVEADYDAVGMYGVDDSVPPGWGAIRYSVKISSAAPEERVREVVEFADRHSPLLDDFRRPVPVTRELQITAPTRK